MKKYSQLNEEESTTNVVPTTNVEKASVVPTKKVEITQDEAIKMLYNSIKSVLNKINGSEKPTENQQ